MQEVIQDLLLPARDLPQVGILQHLSQVDDKLILGVLKAQICRRGSDYALGSTGQESEIRGDAVSKNIRPQRVPWR